MEQRKRIVISQKLEETNFFLKHTNFFLTLNNFKVFFFNRNSVEIFFDPIFDYFLFFLIQKKKRKKL